MYKRDMLLTRPLTTFLSRNTSPQLPTLLLVSPDGKLLASSSPLPAAVLRTQSTVASTLWNLYSPFQSSNDLISSALPPSKAPPPAKPPRPSKVSPDSESDDNHLGSITIQLSHGIMVLRALSCGILFVAIGPVATPSASAHSVNPNPHTLLTPLVASNTTSPPSSPPQNNEGQHESIERNVTSSTHIPIESKAPSIAGSVGSSVVAGRAQASILGVKRHADDVGVWLEKQLRGFVLGSAEFR
ncbi:hypothetical protein HYALB_00004680 [Hymenoscyphus albidus]|uniref:Uncharacterized protein n=1 Tax=Hymenoscyphus albidus TaxID=595503 RepID=A0A9N9LUB8_9HELO|nr:hypothetical protein HYALB_00004680 [Hymenoscyphus albidus]